MTTAAEMEAKVNKLETNMDRLDAIVNGGAVDPDISVDSGSVPTISKVVAELQAISVDGINFFANTTLGNAGTSLNGFFRVMSGDGLSYTLYRHDAGPVATSIAAFPTAAAVTAKADLAELNRRVGSDTLLLFQTLGKATTPIAGTSVSHTTFGTAGVISNSGYLALLPVYGINGGGVIHLKFYTFNSGTSTFTQVADYAITIAAGPNLLTPTNFGYIPVTAGWHWGFHGGGTNGVNQKIGITAGGVSDDGGWYSSGTSDGNIATPWTDTSVSIAGQFEIGIVVAYQSVTSAAIAALQQVADSALLRVQNLTNAVIAASGTSTDYAYVGPSVPSAGLASSQGTYMFAATFTGAGDMTIDSYVESFNWMATGDGFGTVGVWERSGITCTAVKTFDVTWTGSGLKHIDEGVDWDLEEVVLGRDQFLGMYHNGTVAYLGVSNPQYYYASGKKNQFDDSSLTPNFEIQVNATIRYRSVAEAGVTVRPLPVIFDVFMIIGQSNEMGTADEMGETPRTGTAYMWKTATNTLVPMADPIGNIGTVKGSWGCAFATEYFDRTGRGVIIVNVARSGSGLSTGTGGLNDNWSSTGGCRAVAITAWNALIAYLDANSWAYRMAGLLGVSKETDAIAIDAATLTDTTYYNELGLLRTYMETNTGMGSKMIWIYVEQGTLVAGNTTGAQKVRAKQRAFARANQYTYMGWVGAQNLKARDTAHGSQIYMKSDNLHLTGLSQAECGIDMAVIASALCVGAC